jgi:ATP-dependent DNA ligase
VPDGIADFEKLHSRTFDDDVRLYAFDLLELNGQNMRGEPLDRRRSRTACNPSSKSQSLRPFLAC